MHDVRTIRLANLATGDDDLPQLAARLAAAAELDFLTANYLGPQQLGELAWSARELDQPRYVGSYVDLVGALNSALYLQPRLAMLSTAGGADPGGCAGRIAQLLIREGNEDLPVAAVSGDNLKNRLEELMAAGCPLANVSDDQPLSELSHPILAAHAELGYAGLALALGQGARLVVAGHTSPVALALAPLSTAFGWDAGDLDRRAGAVVAGRILAGGAAAVWDRRHDAPVDPGRPILDVADDGILRVTKSPDSSGTVNCQTVRTCLTKGNSDLRWTTPDLVVDLSTVQIDQLGDDLVQVSGATGQAAPDSYDVDIVFDRGYLVRSLWRIEKGDLQQRCADACELVRARLRLEGVASPDVVGTCHGEQLFQIEIGAPQRGVAEQFCQQLNRLGAVGLQGVWACSDRPYRLRPRRGHWRTVVPRERLDVVVDCRLARDWL